MGGQEIFAEAVAASRFPVSRLSAIAKLRSARKSADIVFVENDGEEQGLRVVCRSIASWRSPAIFLVSKLFR